MSIGLQNLDTILEEERLSRAPEWDSGGYFTFFVMEQLLKNTGASVDDIINSIVDGGNDCGIDAIIFLIDDIPASHYPDLNIISSDCKIEMVVLQAKHATTFEDRPLLEMASSFPKLLDRGRDEDSMLLWCNPELRERTAEYLQALPLILPKFPNFHATVYYASRGSEPHPKVQEAGESVTRALKTDGQFQQAQVEFLGFEKLLQFARQQNKTAFTIRCATQPMASPDGNGYVGLLRLPDYRRFVTADEETRLNTQLFESNVRDHEGRNEVNDAIQNSLERSGPEDDFWWLNNGVTIVATRIQPNGHELFLESPQVVNGLQTSTEVWLSHLQDNDGRLILVRVIKATDGGVRDRIIQATNYQTAIPKSALRATDPRQRDLEEWLLRHGVYYDRRRNYYANLSVPIEHIVSMQSVAEAVGSCMLQEPHMARSRGNQLMSMDSNYERIFESDTPEIYLHSLKMVRKSREAVATHTAINTFYADDWVYHLACVATILLTRKDKPKAGDIAGLEPDSVPAERLNDLIPLVAKHLAGSRQSTLPLRKQAENPAVTSRLLKDARELLRNSRWSSWPTVSVDDDFLGPASRLDPRRR